jgi:hypothetical protein
MKDLHDTLRAKEAQLAQLQKEVETLRNAVKILANEVAAKPKAKRGSGKSRIAALPGVELTQPVMIRAVLMDKGEPLHVEKISDEIKRKYAVKLNPQYLTAIIYRAMKKNRFFRRVGANTFGLLEWPQMHSDVNSQNSLRLQ